MILVSKCDQSVFTHDCTEVVDNDSRNADSSSKKPPLKIADRFLREQVSEATAELAKA